MGTPLELLRDRLATLRMLASQRGFSKNKKDAALKIPIFENAVSILERAEANAGTSEKDLTGMRSYCQCFVSVKERYPEKITIPKPQSNGNTLYFYKEYLVRGIYDNGTIGHEVSVYKPCSVSWYFTRCENFKITHWCQIPEM